MLRKRPIPRLVALIIVISLAALPSAAASTATSPVLTAADSYSVLAGSIVTNTGPSTLSGDLGVSPSIGVPPHVTGFPPGIVDPPGAIHDADENAGLAQADATAAFGALSAVPNANCDFTYVPEQDLVGMTLEPGVHCFPTSAHLTTGVALTLDGGGDPNATWIFRVASGLSTTPGVGATVRIVNGGLPCNVWWQVGSSATIGSGTTFIGNILALTSISLSTGASLDGRALAQTGAVTLDTNTIFGPTCIPTAVELLYFQSHPLSDQQVQLTWATALEVDNFGYKLYRANVNDVAVARAGGPIHFEPAVTQGSGSGATYAYVDTVPAASPWWYWLSDVDTNGLETFHDAPVNTTGQPIPVPDPDVWSFVYLPCISR